MLAFFFAACCVLSGNVSADGGQPIAGARVEAHGVATVATRTDAHGGYSLQIAPGSYRVTATARGYKSIEIDTAPNADEAVSFTLEPLDSPKLRLIGTAVVDGRLTPVQGALPSTTVTRNDLALLGDDRIIDGLEALPGATFTRPDGGAASAIAVVSLRGPDPSESLVALDGQLLNDGNTGDLDLSRFPVAAFSVLDVTLGLGPEDANGSNTFGGAINLVSLQPTQTPHVSYSLSGGSFGQSEGWINATGTHGRLGYAIALDDQNESGYTNETVPLYQNGDAACAPCATPLGSSVASHLALANLTWTFAQDADLTARVFALGDLRDQSSAINGTNGNASEFPGVPLGAFVGPGDQTFAQDIRAYQLRARAPLGAGELTADLSESDNDVVVDGNSATPYDIDHRDQRYNFGATWQRTFATAQFAIGGYTRYETLDFNAPPPNTATPLTPGQIEPALAQTIDVGFVRGGFQASPNLRLDGGLFESFYTSFGSNLDGRLGAIEAIDPRTSVRFSVGTGFRAPLLAERYALPYSQLALDANGVFVGQGSPNERPEHATEYELGASRALDTHSTLDVSLYRTNLRDPIEIYYPAAALTGGCLTNSYANPLPQCVSYNSNVGNAVYEGAEFRFVRRFVPAHLFLTALYGINIAYPKDLNAEFSNPTSGGTLVEDAQFLGIPQQQGSLALDWANAGWHAGTSAIFRGNNNELDQAPFTLLNALVGRHIGRSADLSLQGTNILNAAAGRFTAFGAGVPYRGVTGQDDTGGPVYGDLPTNAAYIEPFGARLILTVKT
jgi:outer membrane receptor protein involved in Fe transport